MSYEELDYKQCKFTEGKWFIAQVTEEGIFLRTPEDVMIPINHHADFMTNAARAVFMAKACNDVLFQLRIVTL